MDPIETINHRGLRIDFYQDPEPPDPREWENLGMMVCWHRHANLGDETIRTENYESMDDLIANALPEHNPAHRLPLYLYEHSGMTISTVSFNDPWDSGQVGWIVAPTLRISDWYKDTEVPSDEEIRRILTTEVEEYDAYLRGDAYGYRITDPDNPTTTYPDDSCWGYLGDLDSAKADARAAADNLADQIEIDKANEADEARYWAKYGIPTN